MLCDLDPIVRFLISLREQEMLVLVNRLMTTVLAATHVLRLPVSCRSLYSHSSSTAQACVICIGVLKCRLNAVVFGVHNLGGHVFHAFLRGRNRRPKVLHFCILQKTYD